MIIAHSAGLVNLAALVGVARRRPERAEGFVLGKKAGRWEPVRDNDQWANDQ